MNNGPATIPDTGLDWVTFAEEEHAEACHFRSTPCSAQATHVGYFQTAQGCPHSRNLYCLAHRDLILTRAVLNGGLFFCTVCLWNPRALFLRMEAL